MNRVEGRCCCETSTGRGSHGNSGGPPARSLSQELHPVMPSRALEGLVRGSDRTKRQARLCCSPALRLEMRSLTQTCSSALFLLRCRPHTNYTFTCVRVPVSTDLELWLYAAAFGRTREESYTQKCTCTVLYIFFRDYLCHGSLFLLFLWLQATVQRPFISS